MRQATIERETREPRVTVSVKLDGTGGYESSTGSGFLVHMLEQLARHALIDLHVRAEGDLHIDYHHTNEDTALAIGEGEAPAILARLRGMDGLNTNPR